MVRAVSEIWALVAHRILIVLQSETQALRPSRSDDTSRARWHSRRFANTKSLPNFF